MPTRYSDVYREVCLNIQRTVEQRIGRSLTSEEQLGIWNAGSLMMLEAVDHEIMHTPSNADLPPLLQRNAVTFHERFTTALMQAKELIAHRKMLAFLYRHRKRLEEAQTVYDLLTVTEHYPQYPTRSA